MDSLALIFALCDLTDAEMGQAVSAYIEAHPEAIADVSVASVPETTAYLGIS